MKFEDIIEQAKNFPAQNLPEITEVMERIDYDARQRFINRANETYYEIDQPSKT